MTIDSFWHQFRTHHPAITTDTYDAYMLGAEGDVATADHLAGLIKAGTKTATTSAYDLYGPDEPLPRVGEYSIVLDGHHQPVCVTQTVVVETVPFLQVSAEHAYHEGEGTRGLKEWRQVHREFFRQEYAASHRLFDEQHLPCVCEVFRVLD